MAMNGSMLQGLSLIGAQRGLPAGERFSAVNPVSGESLQPLYFSANAQGLDQALQLAAEAAPVFAALDCARRSELLRTIAGMMEAARGDFEFLVPLETGLPKARAAGELSRTIGQLRLFADWIDQGEWLQPRIDHAEPQRVPLAKPDLRSMMTAIGPVAVFGASNFPLAFSVAGGDTVSALAAGCPVVVKAHPAHPATSERAGLVIQRALKQCALPPGCFSLLFDAGNAIGSALAGDRRIRAVAFTGSRQGGRALMDIAAARPDPIPVFAEMGSINPVFVLAAACASRGIKIAQALHASAIQGVGQFCTNPGLLVIPTGRAGDALVDELVRLFAATASASMLSASIAARHDQGVRTLAAVAGVEVLVRGRIGEGQVAATLLTVEAGDFLRHAQLQTEVFGPCSLIVRYADVATAIAISGGLEGQLTATLIADDDDQQAARALLEPLTRIAGRVLMNSVPTGVEPTHAMLHGGPWPAASEARSGSVGTAAIERFCRRVCYQDVPDSMLPMALREANPLGLPRLVDGQRTP
jgi:2,5-dioxopentanoate dehydrogenase